MTGVEVLDRLEELGVSATANGGNIQLRPGSRVPQDLMDEVRAHKAEILSKLQHQAELIDLPFPLGYGGLPADEVARAEASTYRLGIVDPVNRRLNVLVWMRDYYRQLEDVEMAATLRDAYDELRHADPTIQALCGLCEYREDSAL